MSSLTIENFKALIDRYHFSDILPYIDYEPKEQIYMLNDGVGFVMECNPMASTGTDTWQQLKSIFEIDFPENSSISFMIMASPYIDGTLARWAGFRKGTIQEGERRQGGLFRKMARYRFDFLKKGVTESMYPGLEGRFRDFRLVISVKIPSGGSYEEVQANSERLIHLRQSVKQQFSAMNLYTEQMSADRLGQLLSFILNPGHDEWKQFKYATNREMRKQLISADNIIRIKENYLEVDKHPVALQTVRQYPESIPLWEMTNLLGDQISNNRQIPVPFISVMHAQFPDQTAEKKRLQVRSARATYQGVGKLAQYIQKLAFKKQNYDIVMRGIDAGGQIIRIYHQLLLFGRTEEETNRGLQAAKALYQSKGFVLQSDQYIAAPLFVNALPLGFLTNTQKEIDRTHTMTSLNAANLVPIEADFSGTKTPTMLFESRRGQPMTYDLFDNEGNYNATIAAASGSGKSYLANYFIDCYLSTFGFLRIIDVGRSYENTCKIYNGTFIEFSENSKISLNPFSKLRKVDKEELAILIPLIGQMASPGRRLTDWEKNTLERAITEVFLKYANKTTIDHIADYLKAQEDLRARDLGTQLFSYTSLGRRGSYFMGENNVDMSNPLVVLELEELKTDPDLQSVVLLLLLYNIAQQVYLSGSTANRIVVIIDEAWSLLGDGPAAEFIETAYRRFRKYGAAAITITQGINDYFKSAATRACLDNSDWTFLLRQKQESIIALKESKRLALMDHWFDMLSTVHTVSGQYSEVFINCSKGPAIGRLFSDGFSYWLYTSNPVERALLNAFKKQNMPLEDAVEACVATKVLLTEGLRRGRKTNEAIELCVADFMSKLKKYDDRDNKEKEVAYA